MLSEVTGITDVLHTKKDEIWEDTKETNFGCYVNLGFKIGLIK